MSKLIRIATRQSPLALWQAEYVKAQLLALHSDLTVELLPMKTKGDRILDAPLAKVGGKGLFVKELEQAMLEGRADIAVHSMKDVPMEFPEGLGLSVICPREEPFDAFVSNHHAELERLPIGAIVGTSSLRRAAQLKHWRPDLQIANLRGNVQTRLAKLDADEYDAIVLAQAGLLRLEMHDRIAQVIPAELSLPACGQGAVGIECRLEDEQTQALLAPLACADTTFTVGAERAMNLHLKGGCQVPIAGYATLDGDTLSLEGRVGSTDGERVLVSKVSGDKKNAEAIGVEVAELLLAQGADEILKAVYDQG